MHKIMTNQGSRCISIFCEFTDNAGCNIPYFLSSLVCIASMYGIINTIYFLGVMSPFHQQHFLIFSKVQLLLIDLDIKASLVSAAPPSLRTNL